MALETATYIGDLDSANPLGSDQKSKGDDHLRLIKACLKASLSGFTGPVIIYGADTGSVNNYALTPSPALGAYVTGMMILLTPSATNTTSSTINISALGTKAIVDVAGNAVTSGDLVAGSYYQLVYNGTDFRIINGITKNYADQLAFSGTLPSQTSNGGKYLTTDGSNASWFDILTSPALLGTPTGPTAAADTNTTQLATTAFVIGQGYAKLAGPTFTGNVTVPTLAADATSAYAINAAWYGGQVGTANPLINGTAAPGTSKKWTPIDHVHPTDTSRAALASPTFTGVPAGPTASAGTNTTQLATTAFVVGEIGNQAATQTQMEAASSNAVVATPGNTNWHPGVSKCWIKVTWTTGTPSNIVSHNVTSITDAGTGLLTVTIATDFSSANYVAVAQVFMATNDKERCFVNSVTAGTFQITIRNDSGVIDPDGLFVACFGDQ